MGPPGGSEVSCWLRVPPRAVRGCYDVWTHVFSRPTRLVVQGMTLVGVVAGTVAFASADKAVQLTVDGKTRTVHAWGDSVADVLASEGLQIGGHDTVSPSLDSEVADGTDVVLRYGRQLTVTIDGRPREYWTTALTVDEALAQVGLRSDTARLSVARSLPLGRRGLDMDLNSRKTITLVVGGRSSSVRTYAGTIGDLLTERGLSVGALDRMSAAKSAPLLTGTKVRLDRVVQRRGSGTTPLDFQVKSTKSSAVDKGETKIITRGRPGSAKSTYLDTYVNGERSSRKILTKVIIVKPVTQVQQVGTRVATLPDSSADADALNWAALAECESGGNPRAVNPAGYYGLYQFSLETWGRVGGSGNPIDASPDEQTARAKTLYDRAGAGQWGCGSHLFD
jgi:resuscitation-promoting factor RpfB